MSDLHQYLVDEVIEDYAEGHLSRRRALTMLISLVGSVAAAQLLNACTSNPAQPAGTTPTAAAPTEPPKKSPLSVAADDPSVLSEWVEVMSGKDKVSAYLARPNDIGKHPIILVCSENRGLTTHIQDVTRRVARAGYCAISVDLVSREGGTPKLEADAISGILGKAPPEHHVQDFVAALEFAKKKPYARATDPGMIGFCFGGGITWRVAVALPELKAAVPFYGPQPPLSDVPKIKAAVLAIYGEKDTRINAGIVGIETAMKKNGRTFEKMIFADSDHAFNNDTGPRYNEAAALQAWEKTLAWLKKYCG